MSSLSPTRLRIQVPVEPDGAVCTLMKLQQVHMGALWEGIATILRSSLLWVNMGPRIAWTFDFREKLEIPTLRKYHLSS